MKVRLPKSGFGSMQNLQKMALEMQDAMNKANSEFDEKEFEITSGGGAVKIVVSGKPEVKTIKITPELVNPDDVALLEETVVAAINEALRVISAKRELMMNEVSTKYGIPQGSFDMFK